MKATPFFNDEDHFALVWLGDLGHDEMQEYVEEPGGAPSGQPISLFGADVSSWYDHDFLWGNALPQAGSVADLLAFCGFQDSGTIHEIRKTYGRDHAQCVLVLWNARRDAPSDGRLFAGGRMKFVGCWQHTSPVVDP